MPAMTDELAHLATDPRSLAAILVLARMAALVFTLPLISSRHVPFRLRIGLVIAMAIPVALSVPALALQSGFSALDFGIALVHEALVGAVMGLSAQVVLAAARVAGSVLESLSGMSFPEMNPSWQDDGSGGQILSRLFWWTTLAVFTASGGATAVIGGALASFEWWPPGTANFQREFIDFLVLAVGNGFEFGLRAALPGVIALLVASAVVGITQRSCPQLGGMQIGLTIKTVAGVLATSLVLLSTPWIISKGLEDAWQTLIHLVPQQHG